jgi:hypothetical protein
MNYIKFTSICMLLCGSVVCSSAGAVQHSKSDFDDYVFVSSDQIDDAKWKANCSPSARPGFLCATAIDDADQHSATSKTKTRLCGPDNYTVSFSMGPLLFNARID